MNIDFAVIKTEDMFEAANLIHRYKIALADAIRRPMGVIPESANGLVSADELFEAEKRREG